MIMSTEFPNGISQRVFAKQDQSLQTTFLDRSHKSFRVRIQIRAPSRQFHRFDSSVGKYAEKLTCTAYLGHGSDSVFPGRTHPRHPSDCGRSDPSTIHSVCSKFHRSAPVESKHS